MLLVGGLAHVPNMIGFIGIWMVVMACQRGSTVRAMRRGVIRHSRYEGDVDTKWIKSRKTMKQLVEPLVCVFAGVCIEVGGLSHELAVFVGSGAFSLALVAAIDRQLDETRVRAMRDAGIEQSYLVARLRGEVEDS